VLIADVGSKAWAEVTLSGASASRHSIVVIKDTLNFVLAYNQGGAWGLFHGAADAFRKPFFVLVSLAAVAFIVSLYRKIHEGQWALKWGLPLVLGGAIGNLTDRVTRIGVVDFIDYRADWVLGMNQLIAKVSQGWTVTDHWPTFNVADIAICIGVVLMALDVLFAKRHPAHPATSLSPAAAKSGPVS
jgi:signal peptidase II